ncbi:MAG: hypothetical protein WCG02_02750 [Candidatus Taylorbacteria bacterium]
MSKHQTIRAIRTEIEKLNREIDICIIRGIPYARQAFRHKALRAQLARVTSSSISIFGNLVKTFLF